ncbi:alpha/beta hydrolase [Prochlorococcus sp. MIT 1341]|uniref:alpha/beta hydrolase n=1 Tax=Prochlorococcus sp. MIT 1341 TaxID=3096221 RepID=UPI002A758C48|nr:alpha/beta hydrolase [Prochlorococcus sp. MIT 1341]
MAEKINIKNKEEELLFQEEFRQKFPWIGGDLQTLRDTFYKEDLPFENGKKIEIDVPEMPNRKESSGKLLAILDMPSGKKLKALILMIHGLGGSTRRQGLRRMSLTLQKAGFATLRLNLRGAYPGRDLSPGSYAAECNSDIEPVLKVARNLCKEIGNDYLIKEKPLPLFGAGISLGGTILLNACLKIKDNSGIQALDGLACTSSPLDLSICSKSIERPRNKFYQNWLLRRLVQQTLADKTGLSIDEKEALENEFKGKITNKSIKSFDSIITAPRWGYKSVDNYYRAASPLKDLILNNPNIPQTLFLQSEDDPWVPSESAKLLAERNLNINDNNIRVILSKLGGHNGFHGINGCWGDQIVKRWFDYLTY